jgi:hypothetical protein
MKFSLWIPFLFLGACFGGVTTHGGTDTGNPGGKVASALCGRIEECHRGVPDGCATALRITLEIPEDIDLAACREAIQDISCSSDAMGEAWSSEDPDNFSAAEVLLDETGGACTE